ncbi:MAG: hypothetical protein JNN20_08560 [Betaproteobacteria bacterium]|nr:hypothetical protein [Betaproteobacteria bacterium]
MFLVHFIVGCASTVSAPPAVTPEDAVATRAQERWDALLARDMEKAYGFISPAGRISMSLEVYRGRVNPQYWRKIKVKEVSCKPDVCEVVMDLDYSFEGIALKTLVNETWIFDSGKWWIVYKG